MKDIIILFLILLTGISLMIYFLKKDYKENWSSKKIITYSKNSKVAMFISFGCIGTITSLSEKIYGFYNIVFFNSRIDNILLWIFVPIASSFICLSVFYFTYSIEAFKRNNMINN
jgi:hypothetical protein